MPNRTYQERRMANSAHGPCEDQTREIVPSDLLFVHQGLEEDGSSWRAALPLADDLLRRVAVFPAHTTPRLASDFRPNIPALPTPAPSESHNRHCRRHTRH